MAGLGLIFSHFLFLQEETVGALVYAEVVAALGVLVCGGCLLVKAQIVKKYSLSDDFS